MHGGVSSSKAGRHGPGRGLRLLMRHDDPAGEAELASTQDVGDGGEEAG